MHDQLNHIDTMLVRLVSIAEALPAESSGHVQRSVEELRAAFAARTAIEPAVARVRESLSMLRIGNRAGARREFQRRGPGLDQLGYVIEQELLPSLRRLGFDL